MYPSDYGYATSGGSTGSPTDRNSCLGGSPMHSWNFEEDCYTNDWLFDGESQWTITPYTGNSTDVFSVHTDGIIGYDFVNNINLVARPVVYLVSNIKLKSGTGSQSNPFEFTLDE